MGIRGARPVVWFRSMDSAIELSEAGLTTIPHYRPLPAPSSLPFSSARFPDAPPAFVIRLVLGIRRFFRDLADRLTPPEIIVFERATGIAETALIGAVTRHAIPDLLEERGPLDASTIAAARGLDADAVHRTLRALAVTGLFTMLDDGRFENNRVSRVLCSGRVLRSREWALYFSSGSNAAAWLDYSRTLETGKSAFTRVHGMDVWQWFDRHPDEREMFAHCMTGLTVMDAPAIASLYPFGEVKRLCDVGGGRGTLIGEIVKRHPNVTGVLCDAPGVIESARDLLTARGVADRVELVPGNFFEQVPTGCDAYIMKNILHDWDDATCKKILGVVRSSMEPGQRLVICETLVERNSRDPLGTRADLQMMVACDQGRERSEAELRALLGACRLKVTRVFPFPTVSVLEARAVP
ncbi:MAG TPA: methyltransferase [Polyangiaceae bacterium]|jgi:hypothetical protein|nr:methyltransferase [Polyangiaceae bacterium]